LWWDLRLLNVEQPFPDNKIGFSPIDVHRNGAEFSFMKWKLLLCVAAVAVAGCASYQQQVQSPYREFGFTIDSVPAPVAGVTPDEAASIYGSLRTATPIPYGQNN
jgi:hypothetical protein